MTNPFLWRKDKRPSIFATDPMFTPRANGKTNAEMQTEAVERRREKGELPGHIDGLGKPSKKREEQLLAYKQHLPIPKFELPHNIYTDDFDVS